MSAGEEGDGPVPPHAKLMISYLRRSGKVRDGGNREGRKRYAPGPDNVDPPRREDFEELSPRPARWELPSESFGASECGVDVARLKPLAERIGLIGVVGHGEETEEGDGGGDAGVDDEELRKGRNW